jgi:hypothetical protein
MNYQYMDAYLEITFPSGNIRRIKKSIIKEFCQYKDNTDKNYVIIYIQGDSYRFEGTFEDLEKNSKTVFI